MKTVAVAIYGRLEKISSVTKQISQMVRSSSRRDYHWQTMRHLVTKVSSENISR